jgi:putative nucleotidyltransferase with HDIG domain
LIKKIRTKDLVIGMFIQDFDASWMDHPFLTNRKKIRNVQEIQLLLDEGITEVYIDTSKGKDSLKAYPLEDPDEELEIQGRLEDPESGAGFDIRVVEEAVPREEASFEEELRTARDLYVEAKTVVRDLFRSVRLGKRIDGERPRRIVQEMIDSVFRNRDALLSLTRLKSFDQYTFQHSLNVAVLSLNLGVHLGILHDELLRLGLGSLLHDLGKTRIPESVLFKSGGLTATESELIKSHAAHGAQIILQSTALPDECATVALNHHERYDGSGYPRGLPGMKVGKFSLIVAIADVYDAMTTKRVYRPQIPLHQALQMLFARAGMLFHPVYVRKFIQCLGVYPVGSVVRLNTGETGVVCRQNHDQPLRPWVRLGHGPEGEPLAHPEDVDLREPDPDGDPPFTRTVAQTLDPGGAELDAEDLLSPNRVRRRSAKLTVVVG